MRTLNFTLNELFLNFLLSVLTDEYYSPDEKIELTEDIILIWEELTNE